MNTYVSTETNNFFARESLHIVLDETQKIELLNCTVASESWEC